MARRFKRSMLWTAKVDWRSLATSRISLTLMTGTATAAASPSMPVTSRPFSRSAEPAGGQQMYSHLTASVADAQRETLHRQASSARLGLSVHCRHPRAMSEDLCIDDLGTLLGVWAHPDDEVYLSASLMAAARGA